MNKEKDWVAEANKACRDGDIDSLKYLISESIYPNKTGIMWAVEYNQQLILEYLLTVDGFKHLINGGFVDNYDVHIIDNMMEKSTLQ